jgi:hypothetical protein
MTNIFKTFIHVFAESTVPGLDKPTSCNFVELIFFKW